VTAVFFYYLVHFALGLLATLFCVPERAGVKYFKLCSAIAAFMLTAAVYLAYRRFGFAGGPGAPGAQDYAPLLASAAAALVLCLLYNRAAHFGWKRAQSPLLAATLLCGAASVVIAAPAGQRLLLATTDFTSILLLGAAAAAMILGHFYLVVIDLPIQALRRLTVLLIAALLLRTLVVGALLLGPVAVGLDDAQKVAHGLWSPDGVFVWMRVLFGIAGPFSLVWFIWKTVEIRSTQSATGILYVQLFLVMSGELLAKYLRVAAGLPL
jgi:protein NrfD